jgi:hypothetical protein
MFITVSKKEEERNLFFFFALMQYCTLLLNPANRMKPIATQLGMGGRKCTCMTVH